MNTSIKGFEPGDELESLGQVDYDYIPRAAAKEVGAVADQVSVNFHKEMSLTWLTPTFPSMLYCGRTASEISVSNPVGNQA